MRKLILSVFIISVLITSCGNTHYDEDYDYWQSCLSSLKDDGLNLVQVNVDYWQVLKLDQGKDPEKLSDTPELQEAWLYRNPVECSFYDEYKSCKEYYTKLSDPPFFRKDRKDDIEKIKYRLDDFYAIVSQPQLFKGDGYRYQTMAKDAAYKLEVAINMYHSKYVDHNK